ncbi:retrovirus-related pol polyprotein from transposon TNT 1-94 [Tanacetum coccineum]
MISKKRPGENNEAKMVIYNALPRKEYERIFMCNTAKEIWKTLLITIKFVISEDESIDSAFARFNTIITSLKALDEGYSSKNYVRKFLKALHPKWEQRSRKLTESKDLTSYLLMNYRPLRDKNQREFVGGSWSDSGEEDDEKIQDETCLVAQAPNEVCSESSYFSDENSSIDNLALDNEYDKLCKMSLKIITKNKRLKSIRNILENELRELKDKSSILEKNKGVDLDCVKCHTLKIENEKLKKESTRLNKFEKSTHCLNEMLNNQKPSGDKLGLGFNSFEASSSGTKEIKFVRAQKKTSSDGGPIIMGDPLNIQAAPKINMGPPPATSGSEKSVSFQKSILGPRPKHIIVNKVKILVASDNEVKQFYKPLKKPGVIFSKTNFRSKAPPPRRVDNNYSRPKTPQPKRHVGRQNQPHGFHICLGVDLEPDEWIKDSGCSKHMTGNRKLFSTYKAYNGGNVIFGSNLRGNIIGKGTISNDSLKIDNVEHVDNLGFNLLSIGQICDNKCRVTFSEHDSEITKDGKVIGRGIRKKGLYVMKLGNKPKDKICLATIDENSTLWHRRLGHANMRLIQSLASKELVRNLPKLKFDQHFCDACKIGKQAHVSHKAKNIVSTTRCLELLHMDLFGPSAVRSYGGNRYTLVIAETGSIHNLSVFTKMNSDIEDDIMDPVMQCTPSPAIRVSPQKLSPFVHEIHTTSIDFLTLIAKQRVAKQRVAKQRVAKQRVAKQRVAKQRVAKQRVAKQRVAKQRVAKQRVAKQRVHQSPTSVLIAAVEAAENIPPVAAHEEAETIHNMTTENKLYFQAEKEAIFLILTGIGDEIYSTVDACNTAKEMWTAIERLQQVIQKPARGRRLCKKNWHSLQVFKKLYKPTNNNLRTSSNSRNKTEDTTPSINTQSSQGSLEQRTMTVAGARETVGSPVVQQNRIQCFNCKGF